MGGSSCHNNLRAPERLTGGEVSTESHERKKVRPTHAWSNEFSSEPLDSRLLCQERDALIGELPPQQIGVSADADDSAEE